MVEKVFFVMEGSGTDKKINYPYALVSASVLWDKKRLKFKGFKGNSNIKNLTLDSGSFNFFQVYEDFPYKFYEYVNLAIRLEANHVVVMDYPCEPQTNRCKYKTVTDRIHQTVKNTHTLLHLAPDLNWISVIQGYEVKEYLYCLNLLKEEELLTPIMAIGTLCARRDVYSTRKIILAIRREVPKHVKLHGFGIDLRFLKNRDIFNCLWSCDTGAWRFGVHENGYLPQNDAQKLVNFERYTSKVRELLDNYACQTKLKDETLL